ncbi:MAG: AmmeMemoRadiSam system protein B [Thermodesulfobacteriota bacterium]|nr:AmmeMemoRadiSam system protein B [Thermodesulfobacteriota bacterium]
MKSIHYYMALAVLACFLVFPAKPAPARENIRESVLAGMWYPGSAADLRDMVGKFLDQAAAAEPQGRLTALVAPHAGYPYSGPIAAHAYKLLYGKKFETVVVIGPSHHAAFPGVSVYDQGGYQTPLGLAPLDKEFITELTSISPTIRYVPKAHAREHSVEIELPFLQVAMPGFKLVPLVMGEQSMPTCQNLAKALARAAKDKSVLIVASSDLSHFHSSSQARKLDAVVQKCVRDFDPESLFQNLARRKCEACGGGPMITAMLASKAMGANKGVVLAYGDSGDTTGDHSRVVGYMAAAFFAQDNKDAPKNPGKNESALSPDDKKILHQVARQAIQAKFNKQTFTPPENPSDALQQIRGAFVTLKKKGELRGCIGHIIGHLPLHETVAQMALAAAFSDPRFPKLRANEFEHLEFEISALTPLEKITSVERIEVGKHGLLMRQGFRQGVLLPQVPVEWGWDRDQFLDYTCRKAGLAPGCWKDPDTEIFTFSAEVF